MAIYHMSVQCISRSAGRSATAAAAYRAGDRVRDERLGQDFDYRRRSGVEHSELIMSTTAPAWAADRERLWNEVEAAERRKNSTVAREFNLALPSELNSEQRRELVRDFSRQLVERHGVVCDVAIHAPGKAGDQRNYHAHILCTTRRVHEQGLGEKTRELDQRTSQEIPYWREQWAHTANRHLERAGVDDRIDHRSLEAQGVERIPQIHLGPQVIAMAERGKKTDRADEFLRIERCNARIEALEKALNETQRGMEHEYSQSTAKRERLRRERGANAHRDDQRAGAEPERGVGRGAEGRTSSAQSIQHESRPESAAGHRGGSPAYGAEPRAAQRPEERELARHRDVRGQDIGDSSAGRGSGRRSSPADGASCRGAGLEALSHSARSVRDGVPDGDGISGVPGEPGYRDGRNDRSAGGRDVSEGSSHALSPSGHAIQPDREAQRAVGQALSTASAPGQKGHRGALSRPRTLEDATALRHALEARCREAIGREMGTAGFELQYQQVQVQKALGVSRGILEDHERSEPKAPRLLGKAQYRVRHDAWAKRQQGLLREVAEKERALTALKDPRRVLELAGAQAKEKDPGLFEEYVHAQVFERQLYAERQALETQRLAEQERLEFETFRQEEPRRRRDAIALQGRDPGIGIGWCAEKYRYEMNRLHQRYPDIAIEQAEVITVRKLREEYRPETLENALMKASPIVAGLKSPEVMRQYASQTVKAAGERDLGRALGMMPAEARPRGGWNAKIFEREEQERERGLDRER